MTTINYVYLTSAFSVTESLGTIVVQMDSLQYFANNQIIKMIKSLNDEMLKIKLTKDQAMALRMMIELEKMGTFTDSSRTSTLDYIVETIDDKFSGSEE
ncbi:hypothetical protein SPHG1_25 [Salmonella phage SPHG1]|nr:hypothetical protein SPHG1_25 [Salmonella phage SPHG1]